MGPGNRASRPDAAPPRTIARLTQARPPCTFHRQDVDVRSATFSIACWCSTRDSAPSGCAPGRLLELELFGVRQHPRFDLVQHRLRLAAQEKRWRRAHVLRVVGRRHHADAGPRAALDLEQQAGPAAVPNTVSSQVRRRNTFCISWIVSLTAQALG